MNRRDPKPVGVPGRHAGVLGMLMVAAAILVLATATRWSLKPVPELSSVATQAVRAQLLDRNGRPLTMTYRNRWNRHNVVALHRLPPLLLRAFVASEDKRFFQHAGVDWWARLHAAWQNILAGQALRGASTISEQVVRMLNPRPRTLWSRWLEGFEAQRLEVKNNKAAILEFYLNQVPYAARRRGIVQAASYYFDRDLSTLTAKEMLALAVMVRAPAYLDVYKHPQSVEARVVHLATRLLQNRTLDTAVYHRLPQQELRASAPAGLVEARHFGRHVYSRISGNPDRVYTTLDAGLQHDAQRILDQRLAYLGDKQVDNAALVVVDHSQSEVLAWVVGGAESGQRSAGAYDAVLSPRQPGSALKPFVYALALSRGWTAATRIDDSPLSESVGRGLHTYRNYSRTHYGWVSLREALGNSLNIPAVKAMQFVGSQSLLTTLQALGIHSLDRHPDHYGDGLALGNGEVTLFELVQAYATLARGGVFEPLHTTRSEPRSTDRRRVLEATVATLIGNILSDPDARRLEFGSGDLLNLPVQTAVKTGTSSDYRDAWAMGYNHRYTVGVWMGNLRGGPMKKITGATGPALVLRALFAELNRRQPARPLPLSPLLVKRRVCIETGQPSTGDCPQRDEWFAPGPWPPATAGDGIQGAFRIRQPHQGLQMALDPRIPDELEAFEFRLNRGQDIERVDWYLDGMRLPPAAGPTYRWQLQRGRHLLTARVRRPDSKQWFQTRPVAFVVK